MEKPKKPAIFSYIDFRSYLNDMYIYTKSESPHFSYRYISQKVGSASPGWFPNIIAGRINLTETYILRLGMLFGLKRRELEYFELIVKFGQTSAIDEKNYYLEKIHEIKGIDTRLLSKDQFEYYRHWYFCALRELFLINQRISDPKQIAPLLQPAISEQEVTEALRILANLGLIEKTVGGNFRATDEIIRKDSNFSSIFWMSNMKEKLKLALGALERLKKEERDFSEVVIPLSEEGMKLASEEIAALRKKLLAISQKDARRNKVFQCSIQLFPLSQKVPE